MREGLPRLKDHVVRPSQRFRGGLEVVPAESHVAVVQWQYITNVKAEVRFLLVAPSSINAGSTPAPETMTLLSAKERSRIKKLYLTNEDVMKVMSENEELRKQLNAANELVEIINDYSGPGIIEIAKGVQRARKEFWEHGSL